MRKILLIMFLIITALMSVGSVSAAIVTCSYSGDLEILDVRFDPDVSFEPGTNINLEIDIQNKNTVNDITLLIDSIKLYVYKSDDTEIDITYPMNLNSAAVVVPVEDYVTVNAVWTVEPNDYIAYNFLGEHKFNLYIIADDGIADCDVSNKYSVTLNNYPELDRPITTKTAIEDDPFTYTVGASDIDNKEGTPSVDILIFSLENEPAGMRIDSLSGSITWTPRNEHVGTNSIIVKVSDGYGGEDTETFDIIVVNDNDAPVLSTIPNYKLQEGVLVVITLPEASDVDGDVPTYSLDFFDGIKPEKSTFELTYFDESTRVISGWIPDKDDIGELKLKFIATDSTGATDSQIFILEIYPGGMCIEGEQGNLDIIIDNPGDDEDFGPGDVIKIEATVDNDASEDKDVIVEAMLYDIKTHKKIAEVESDDEEIEAGKDLSFELEIELSMDSDEEYDGNYVLYVMAYEDGEEDSQCVTSLVDLDISRDKDRVIINDITLSPLSISSGDDVDITVDVLNIGEKDQDEVYVKVVSADLNINLVSDKVELGKFDESNNAHVFRFTNVKVSNSVDTGSYELDISVHYDGDSEKYLDSPTYEAIDTSIVLSVKGPEISGVVEVAELEEATDNSYSVPITVTNTGDPGSFVLSLEGLEDFAEEVEPKNVRYLATGSDKTVYFELVLLEDVEPEEYAIDAVLATQAGVVVSRESFSIDLSEGVSAGTGGWLSSKTFWIIGDIVLIVVAIFFLKMIFGGRKPDVQEVKL